MKVNVSVIKKQYGVITAEIPDDLFNPNDSVRTKKMRVKKYIKKNFKEEDVQYDPQTETVISDGYMTVQEED